MIKEKRAILEKIVNSSKEDVIFSYLEQSKKKTTAFNDDFITKYLHSKIKNYTKILKEYLTIKE